MTMSRRAFNAAAVAAASGLPLGLRAQTPPFPQGTVRIVVPYPPGGPTDAIGRYAAQRLGELWSTPVIVENRAGAGGVVGTQHVAKSPPDGHTLLLAAGASSGSAEVLNPKTVPYRTLRDFSMVGFIGVSPSLMVVNAEVPARTAKEFVELALRNPGKYSYASTSVGSASAFAFEMLKQATGADIIQVPFNGAGPALAALGGGHVHGYIAGVFTVLPMLQSGRARAIGAASEQRIESYPDLPTLREQGIAAAWDTWFGLLAPAGVPEPLLERLNADMMKALDGDEARQALAKQGLERRLGSRQVMRAAIEKEIAEATRVGTFAKMIQE